MALVWWGKQELMCLVNLGIAFGWSKKKKKRAKQSMICISATLDMLLGKTIVNKCF